MKLKKLLTVVAFALSALILVGCKTTTTAAAGSYTYNTYATALANNWNPHTWETNADSAVLDYITTPLVNLTILDSENAIYQWSYDMATSVTDVTAEHQADLTTYGSTLPSGAASVADVESGFVFEISLREGATWEDGTAINADTYIYSMQQLLDSSMRNYRANLYVSGDSAIAGAESFYNSESPIYSPVVPAYGEGDTPDYSFDIVNNKVYINLKSTGMTFSSYSFYQFYDDYGLISAEAYDAVAADENVYGLVEVTAANKAAVLALINEYLAAFNLSCVEGDHNYMEFLFYQSGVGEEVSFDAVGLYKVDDYTIRYVCQTYLDLNYFLTSLTSNWLVYKDLYEANFDTTGELKTTTYGTSLETTMSYGPYKLESFQDAKQMVFVQNAEWYGFTTLDNGALYSETEFLVDGEHVQQYQTTKVVIDVMTDAAAKQSFLSGDLDDWSPSSDELSTYSTSTQLYQVYETYTMSFFFNTNVDDLEALDESAGNTNSVVLSNINFRNAFSLAIDRTEWVTKTAGYAPAYSLLNSLYYYDVYDNPDSIYRNTDEAMQAIVDLYGIEYGEGKAYATLKDAYESVTGYNLTEAKALMAAACDELVAAGLYTEGEDIYIKIAYKKGALDSDDQAQVQLIQNYLNAALEGSGFGTITLEAVGGIASRYAAVPAGEYAIGYGAWGGAAFYPFSNFQVYMDPDSYDINEAADWDPTTETFEITFPDDAKYGTYAGQSVTMTYQDWSNSMEGSGDFAEANFDVKLFIAAALEEQYLGFYYRIPLATSTSCFLLSYKVSYFTENYNIMYAFGGLRLMKYNYTDAEWEAFVAAHAVNGVLSYE
ncbi:MAG: hypothetical protein H6687_03270 [Bacillales bacterium]|nr:hypothetical protein [Bacillales bacterium]